MFIINMSIQLPRKFCSVVTLITAFLTWLGSICTQYLVFSTHYMILVQSFISRTKITLETAINSNLVCLNFDMHTLTMRIIHVQLHLNSCSSLKIAVGARSLNSCCMFVAEIMAFDAVGRQCIEVTLFTLKDSIMIFLEHKFFSFTMLIKHMH